MKTINDFTQAKVTIGEMAVLLNIHQRTLRIYDKENILVPKRNTNNRRYYSAEDFEKARLICFLMRNLAMNISAVKFILAILEKYKIRPENYIEYVNEIANSANIDINTQKLNLEKNARKGRKSIKN